MKMKRNKFLYGVCKADSRAKTYGVLAGMAVVLLTFSVVLAACGGKDGGTNAKRITDIVKVETYLAQFNGASPAGQSGTADAKPETAVLVLNVQLTAENWMGILNSLENAAVQVRLDLSDCKRGTLATGGGLRSDGVFDTNVATEYGRKYIEELILPRATTALADSTKDKSLF
ncbi:hypothetical protein AGMMS50268_00070 [Spirochaetia bacterium]|nr:hypothetical protein AGMMS50268_00070 [Spirochaetia bacterium]